MPRTKLINLCAMVAIAASACLSACAPHAVVSEEKERAAETISALRDADTGLIKDPRSTHDRTTSIPDTHYLRESAHKLDIAVAPLSGTTPAPTNDVEAIYLALLGEKTQPDVVRAVSNPALAPADKAGLGFTALDALKSDPADKGKRHQVVDVLNADPAVGEAVCASYDLWERWTQHEGEGVRVPCSSPKPGPTPGPTPDDDDHGLLEARGEILVETQPTAQTIRTVQQACTRVVNDPESISGLATWVLSDIALHDNLGADCLAGVKQRITSHLKDDGWGFAPGRILPRLDATEAAYRLVGDVFGEEDDARAEETIRHMVESPDWVPGGPEAASASVVLFEMGRLRDEDKARFCEALGSAARTISLSNLTDLQVLAAGETVGCTLPPAHLKFWTPSDDASLHAALAVVAHANLFGNQEEIKDTWGDLAGQTLARYSHYTGPAMLMAQALHAAHVTGAPDEIDREDIGRSIYQDGCADPAYGADLIRDGKPSGESCSLNVAYELRMAGYVPW
ncbi:hypothetical protein ACUY3K_01080 [Corynebacterium uberis]|uniref:hypothetical protein n=1 Tax=Corynebacterium uberis TaxID=2883169 RepID=UPI001D0BC2C7|nr:hypothetical protein [Corynebacterium uberis]UDL74555.1 hypothetical protein LH391_05025 [Corynebacterium uberis]